MDDLFPPRTLETAPVLLRTRPLSTPLSLLIRELSAPDNRLRYFARVGKLTIDVDVWNPLTVTNTL